MDFPLGAANPQIFLDSVFFSILETDGGFLHTPAPHPPGMSDAGLRLPARTGPSGVRTDHAGFRPVTDCETGGSGVRP